MCGKPSDYSIAIIPDQQYLTASYVPKLNGIYQWIADNAEKENMQMVINLGDITDNNSVTHWERALAAYDLIKGKVPFAFVAGNHDYNNGSYRDATNLNKYFTQDLFGQQTTTMKETLQTINAAWTDFDAVQQAAVKALCDQYAVTQTWALTNIFPTEE